MSTAVDGHSLHSPEYDARDVSPTSTFSISESPYEVDLADLPTMTFKSGRRTDDSSDSGYSEVDSDEEPDGRNKPLPAPPASAALSSPKSNARIELNSPSNISHIPNFSTSTVSSYTTASSTSSVPVTPITPNTPVTPFLSTSSIFPSTNSLSRAPSFSRTQSPTVAHFQSGFGTRSRQPSIVSLAGGYHLPTMVAGKTSPSIGHKPSLPLLNDTDVDAEVDTDIGGYFANLGGETNRPIARLTRQPSLGSRPGLEFRAPPGSGLSLPLGSESSTAGVMRRYASAGNLLSNSSSRPSSSNSGHQHSYSHPTPFSTTSITSSPYNSPPLSLPESSDVPAVITSTRSRASSSAGQMGNSRNRSRAGSTVLRNAVYIQALDSNEVERRLLTLSPISDREHSVNDHPYISASEKEEENPDFGQSKWSPASSVVDLRSSELKISEDSSSSFFSKILGSQAPPPTPSTPFSASRSGSYIGLADTGVHQSPTTEDAPKSYLSMNVSKRKSLISAFPVPPSLSQSDLQADNVSVPPVAPVRRPRLASFIARMTGNVTSQVPPVPLTLSSPSPTSPTNISSSSVPPSPTNLRTIQHRPVPLDLSLKPKNSPATDSVSMTGTSEPSTPAYSNSSLSEDSGSETETETEDDMDALLEHRGLLYPPPQAGRYLMSVETTFLLLLRVWKTMPRWLEAVMLKCMDSDYPKRRPLR
ncbi:hypothetical protein DFJ43DRAFT_639539 [Lentinula guzmanii]|uniref:Uncharacterized protein n=1 Tax=Lentinula guzmanii TaxID=2804957 RepID=A0AA38JEB5_9AGAR|nr:hypothetical protein DFJ43DRAFT_639539 [Lentinula guzmanii]